MKRWAGWGIVDLVNGLHTFAQILSLKATFAFLIQGRLNELMSQLRMQNQLSLSRSDAGYQMDTSVQHEIKQVCTSNSTYKESEMLE